MLELRIAHTYVVITALLLRPSTLRFLGHNKGRHSRNRGFSSGLEGRAAWKMSGELELINSRRVVFERLCSPTLKQQKGSTYRYLSSETIFHFLNSMVKGLSIPIARSNSIVKGLSIPIFRNNRFGERYVEPFGQNHRFRLSANILSPTQHRPENVYRYQLVLSTCSDKEVQ